MENNHIVGLVSADQCSSVSNILIGFLQFYSIYFSTPFVLQMCLKNPKVQSNDNNCSINSSPAQQYKFNLMKSQNGRANERVVRWNAMKDFCRFRVSATGSRAIHFMPQKSSAMNWVPIEKISTKISYEVGICIRGLHLHRSAINNMINTSLLIEVATKHRLISVSGEREKHFTFVRDCPASDN